MECCSPVILEAALDTERTVGGNFQEGLGNAKNSLSVEHNVSLKSLKTTGLEAIRSASQCLLLGSMSQPGM